MSAEHVREECFYAKVWKRLLLACQIDRKGATLGGKISLRPPQCCSKFISSCRPSGNGPLRVWALRAICASICAFLSQHNLSNHFFFFAKIAPRCSGKHIFAKRLRALSIRKSTISLHKWPKQEPFLPFLLALVAPMFARFLSREVFFE